MKAKINNLIERYEKGARGYNKSINYSSVVKSLKEIRSEINDAFISEIQCRERVEERLKKIEKDTKKEIDMLHKIFGKLAVDYIALKYGIIISRRS